MKRLIYLAIAIFAVALTLEAQSYVRTVEVTGKTRFATAAGTASGFVYKTADSADVDLIFTNEKLGLIDVYPDSVVFVWATKGTTTADSVGIVFSALWANNNGAFLGRAAQDSALVQENDFKVIARTTYQHKDKLRAVAMINNTATGAANKTATIANGGAAVYFRVKLFYKIP